MYGDFIYLSTKMIIPVLLGDGNKFEFVEEIEMFIRKYISLDCEQLAELFYQSVHTVNAKDYSQEQLDVWATGNVNLCVWNKSFLEHNTFVAIEDNTVVGFGDIDNRGYLNRLFVHKDYQRQGIASELCNKLENGFIKITTHASITAKLFFLRRGYKLVKEQQVMRNGISLTNYVMEK